MGTGNHGNKRVKAIFSKPIEEEVLSFLRNNVQEDQNGTEIHLGLREFHISEKTGLYSEEAICDLAVDFLIKNNTEYQLISSIWVTNVVKGFGVTKKHSENIAAAFKQCFDSLELKNGSSESTNSFSVDSLTSIRLDFPVFKETLKQGVYMDFGDLVENSPDTTIEFIVKYVPRKADKWNGTYDVVPFLKDKKRKVKNPFGFCFRDTAYILHEGGVFPLKIENNTMVFQGYDLLEGEAKTNIMIAGGGLLGALVASEEIKAIQNRQIRYYISPYSGRKNPQYEHKDMIPIVLYRTNKRENPTNIKLYLNDSIVGAFPPYSYLELFYELSSDPMKICVDTSCITFETHIPDTYYFEFTYPRKAQSPILIRQEKEIGSYYSDIARKYQEQLTDIEK